MEIIHSASECLYDVQKLVAAAKEQGAKGEEATSDWDIRCCSAYELDFWVKSVSALMFFLKIDVFRNTCNCNTAWGVGSRIPVSLKVMLD